MKNVAGDNLEKIRWILGSWKLCRTILEEMEMAQSLKKGTFIGRVSRTDDFGGVERTTDNIVKWNGIGFCYWKIGSHGAIRVPIILCLYVYYAFNSFTLLCVHPASQIWQDFPLVPPSDTLRLSHLVEGSTWYRCYCYSSSHWHLFNTFQHKNITLPRFTKFQFYTLPCSLIYI